MIGGERSLLPRRSDCGKWFWICWSPLEIFSYTYLTSIRFRREEQRQVAGLTEWNTLLTCERGIWSKTLGPQFWRLDETEGPYRSRFACFISVNPVIFDSLTPRNRKKMEPDHEMAVSSKVDSKRKQDRITAPESEATSFLQPEVPPWSDTYEISSTGSDGEHCSLTNTFTVVSDDC